MSIVGRLVVTFVSAVVVGPRLVVILECMERASDVILDPGECVASSGRSARIDNGA
jgi:hypothetical protein